MSSPLSWLRDTTSWKLCTNVRQPLNRPYFTSGNETWRLAARSLGTQTTNPNIYPLILTLTLSSLLFFFFSTPLRLFSCLFFPSCPLIYLFLSSIFFPLHLPSSVFSLQEWLDEFPVFQSKHKHSFSDWCVKRPGSWQTFSLSSTIFTFIINVSERIMFHRIT